MLNLEIFRQQNNIVAIGKPSRSQVTTFSNNSNSLLFPLHIFSSFTTSQIRFSV